MSDPLITSGAMYSMVPTPVLLQRLPPGVGTIEYMAPERSEEHTSELQSRSDLVCRLLLEKKKPTARTRRAIARIDTEHRRRVVVYELRTHTNNLFHRTSATLALVNTSATNVGSLAHESSR